MKTDPHWKLAEWVSLIISALVLLGIAGLLLVQVFNEPGPLVDIEIKLMAQEGVTKGGRFFLPIEIENKHGRTITRLKFDVSYRSSQGEKKSRELQIEYLSEKSSRRVYLILDEDPRTLRQLEAKPFFYQLE